MEYLKKFNQFRVNESMTLRGKFKPEAELLEEVDLKVKKYWFISVGFQLEEKNDNLEIQSYDEESAKSIYERNQEKIDQINNRKLPIKFITKIQPML